tara:strand:+ start:636 stop:854 length:219 start_codon:yes stop_codon:yes gene_type:complete
VAEGDVLKKETCRTGNSKEEAEQKGAKLVEVVEKKFSRKKLTLCEKKLAKTWKQTFEEKVKQKFERKVWGKL